MGVTGATVTNVGGTEEGLGAHDVTLSKPAYDENLVATHVEDDYHDKDGNIVYNEVNIEPEIHWRTWIALLAVWLVNFTFSQATGGPPAVVSLALPNCCHPAPVKT